jgi:hypothetical protein
MELFRSFPVLRHFPQESLLNVIIGGHVPDEENKSESTSNAVDFGAGD